MQTRPTMFIYMFSISSHQKIINKFLTAAVADICYL